MIVPVLVFAALRSHTFDLLFFHGFDHVHQLCNALLFVVHRLQNPIHPFIGIAAHIYKQVCRIGLFNVFRRRLKTVGFRPRGHEHRQIDLFAAYLPEKIVLRKYCRDDLDPLIFFCRFLLFRRLVTSAACQKHSRQHHRQYRNNKFNFFHHFLQTPIPKTLSVPNFHPALEVYANTLPAYAAYGSAKPEILRRCRSSLASVACTVKHYLL